MTIIKQLETIRDMTDLKEVKALCNALIDYLRSEKGAGFGNQK